MKTLPFISSSLRVSIALPGIGVPPDETAVSQRPDEAHVVAAIAGDTPDQACRSDIEEVVRDELVSPDETRAGQALVPDESARGGNERLYGSGLIWGNQLISNDFFNVGPTSLIWGIAGYGGYDMGLIWTLRDCGLIWGNADAW